VNQFTPQLLLVLIDKFVLFVAGNLDLENLISKDIAFGDHFGQFGFTFGDDFGQFRFGGIEVRCQLLDATLEVVAASGGLHFCFQSFQFTSFI